MIIRDIQYKYIQNKSFTQYRTALNNTLLISININIYNQINNNQHQIYYLNKLIYLTSN